MVYIWISQSWHTNLLNTLQTTTCSIGISHRTLRIQRSNCCQKRESCTPTGLSKHLRTTTWTASRVWNVGKKIKYISSCRISKTAIFCDARLISSRMIFLMKFSSKSVNNSRKRRLMKKSKLRRILWGRNQHKMWQPVSWRYPSVIHNSNLIQNLASDTCDPKMKSRKKRSSNIIGKIKKRVKSKKCTTLDFNIKIHKQPCKQFKIWEWSFQPNIGIMQKQ